MSDGPSMTLMESLVLSYKVEGMLRDQAKSLEARVRKLGLDVMWLQATDAEIAWLKERDGG